MQIERFGFFFYCNWLSGEAGLESAYIIVNGGGRYIDGSTNNPQSTNSYRVVTADEWMYAARGGKDGAATTYAGSNNLNTLAWYTANSTEPGNSAIRVNNQETYSAGQNIEPDDLTQGTMSVGRKTPNELGLYDMCGNIAEHVATSANLIGFHCYGGSWTDGSSYCGLGYSYPGRFLKNFAGFRIARTK